MRKVLKKLLPNSIVSKIYALKIEINFQFIKLFAKSDFLSSLYYLLFSSSFSREHRSVLKGRLAYKQTLLLVDKSSALLRRNIHRIEKGLIMQPRRDVFAEAYIGETVKCYTSAMEQTSVCTEELKWAQDVLTLYFSVVSHHGAIAKAFEDYNSECEHSALSYVPYKYKDLPPSCVTFEQLETLYKRRRSVRWFENKEVPIALLKQAVNAASLAPSACNRQPYEFYIVNESGKATALAELAMGTAGFAKNIQCTIAIVGDLSAYPAERDRHVIYIDSSLASMQLMLALETLGLATCSINWPDVEGREKAIESKLELPKHKRVIMLMAVGYAQKEGGIPFSQKKSDKLLVKEIS
ncbi:nitroreductase family protein [Shewanella abyssi]|uniref:nitroreductase family protein n=1 Tax=Shewanella abyssi TaxID=311789 RepID=UPI00201000C0|nr:nitroreductase family protein [Shewanella abyssi]MCL1049586.1 nitroreductase family protein [Shewanella abyssi]